MERWYPAWKLHRGSHSNTECSGWSNSSSWRHRRSPVCEPLLSTTLAAVPCRGHPPSWCSGRRLSGLHWLYPLRYASLWGTSTSTLATTTLRHNKVSSRMVQNAHRQTWSCWSHCEHTLDKKRAGRIEQNGYKAHIQTLQFRFHWYQRSKISMTRHKEGNRQFETNEYVEMNGMDALRSHIFTIAQSTRKPRESLICTTLTHDDVIKWNHLPRCYPFVKGIHQSPLNSPHKSQWAELFLFASEQTVEQTIETPMIWDAIAPIMTSF